MEVKFYQAECGDAGSIRFLGTDKKYHNIFIDSGYSRTFRHVLEEEIQKIIDNNEKIDLWIISHIHDDHIGGIIKYIETILSGEYRDVIEKIWYNVPRESQAKDIFYNVSDSRSINQGDLLYSYINLKGKLLNFDLTNSLEPIDIFGLELTILSPTSSQLNKLRKKYKSTTKGLEKQEREDLISDAVSSLGNDYNILLKDFDLSNWIGDDSVENGSSIAILSEYDEKKVLWLADAHPNIIVESIKKLGYNYKDKLECEWVKVAHHGSKGNNSDELFKLLDCKNYVFSVNGENRHNLPNKECVARLLRNSDRDLLGDKYNIYFTYDNEILREIFENDEDNIFDKYHFNVVYLDNKYITINVE